MRIAAACDRGTPAVMRALWLLVALLCVMSCAVTGHEVRVEDTDAVASSSDEAVEAGVAAAPAPGTDELLQLRGTTVETLGSTHRLVFDLSRAPDSISHFRLSGPPRLVLDVRGPHHAARLVDRFVADDPLVERVRVGHYDGRMRLVVDLKDDPPETYSVRREGSALVLYIGELGAVGAVQEPADSSAGDALSAASATEENPRAEASPDVPGSADPAVESSDEAAAAKRVASEEPSLDSPSQDEVESEPVQARSLDVDVPEQEPETSPAVTPQDGEKPRLAKLTGAEKTSKANPKHYTGKRISLDFKDADVQNVLRVIADVSGLNIVATDDVAGRVTLHLIDVPWDQALDVVLEGNRLKMIREGNIMRVSTVDRVREEQEALRAQQDAETELEPLQVRYVRVNYARADEALLEKVKGVLTERGSAAFDERTNTVILRDIRRGVDDAVELVSVLDIQSPQVLIEANLVEATEGFARALGIQWGYRYLAGPATGNPTGADFPGTVNISGSGLGLGQPAPATGGGVQLPVPFMADFPVPSSFGPGFGAGSGSALDLALGSLSGSDTLSARITALEDQGKGKIISRPRVITLNNVPARIESLTILRVRLPSTGTVVNTGTGGVAGTASAATEKIETGIILVVTPQVSSDGFVLLNINAKTSQADFTNTVDEIPTEISRQATSNVLIQDGETVVLGGIFRNAADEGETGIPYLRRVPGIGWLFKRITHSDRKEELIVFITPQVVAGYGAELPTAGQLWQNRLGG